MIAYKPAFDDIVALLFLSVLYCDEGGDPNGQHICCTMGTASIFSEIIRM